MKKGNYQRNNSKTFLEINEITHQKPGKKWIWLGPQSAYFNKIVEYQG